MPNEAASPVALPVAGRGVKGRKSLVGVSKGAKPPWILEIDDHPPALDLRWGALGCRSMIILSQAILAEVG